MPTLVYPDVIDHRLNWPPGRAAKLARRGRLPHYLLPDGSVRLDLDEVLALVQHVQPAAGGVNADVAEQSKRDAAKVRLARKTRQIAQSLTSNTGEVKRG